MEQLVVTSLCVVVRLSRFLLLFLFVKVKDVGGFDGLVHYSLLARASWTNDDSFSSSSLFAGMMLTALLVTTA